ADDVRGHRIAHPKPQRRALLSAAASGRSPARQSGRELCALRRRRRHLRAHRRLPGRLESAGGGASEPARRAGIERRAFGGPTLSGAQLSALNAMGVNGLRALAGAVVLWGARTLAGDDVADPFKFVPLRRLDLFIEDSITRGLQGATFEPNGPSLWERIRAS